MAVPDPFAMIDHIVSAASFVKETIDKYKSAPSDVKKTAIAVESLAAILGQVKKNTILNNDVATTVLKPVQSIVDKTKELTMKYDILLSSTKIFDKLKRLRDADKIVSDMKHLLKEMQNCQTNLQTILSLKNNPARSIPNVAAQEFWLFYFQDKQKVSFHDFMMALTSKFPNAGLGNYKDFLIKPLLDANGDDSVSLLEFSQFVLLVGTFEKLETALADLANLVSFHIRPQDAEMPFDSHLGLGRFCIKQSSGNMGMFSLYYRTKDGLMGKKINHNLGDPKNDEKYIFDQKFAETGKKYFSLLEYIKSNLDAKVFSAKCCVQIQQKVDIYGLGASNQTSEPQQASADESESGLFWMVTTKKNPTPRSMFLFLASETLDVYDDFDDIPNPAFKIPFYEVSQLSLLSPPSGKGLKFVWGGDEWTLKIASSSIPEHWGKKINENFQPTPSPKIQKAPAHPQGPLYE